MKPNKPTQEKRFYWYPANPEEICVTCDWEAKHHASGDSECPVRPEEDATKNEWRGTYFVESGESRMSRESRNKSLSQPTVGEQRVSNEQLAFLIETYPEGSFGKLLAHECLASRAQSAAAAEEKGLCFCTQADQCMSITCRQYCRLNHSLPLAAPAAAVEEEKQA